MSKRDFYDVLGVPKNASDDDIKKAYRKLASAYHPDKHPENQRAGVEVKFKEAKEAYEMLSDPEKRVAYDNYGHAGVDPNTGNRHQDFHHVDPAQFQEIFSQIFGNNNFRFHEQGFGNRTSSTQQFSINIGLADAYTGKTVRVDKDSHINIPAGVRPHTRFYAGGKMYRVEIQQHHKFKRANDDLLIDVSITAIEAMLGVVATIEHLDGAKLQFNIPNGIQNGQIVKLSGKGMKNPELNKTGDLLIRIEVTVPKSLTDAELEVLKTLTRRETINI